MFCACRCAQRLQWSSECQSSLRVLRVCAGLHWQVEQLGSLLSSFACSSSRQAQRTYGTNTPSTPEDEACACQPCILHQPGPLRPLQQHMRPPYANRQGVLESVSELKSQPLERHLHMQQKGSMEEQCSRSAGLWQLSQLLLILAEVKGEGKISASKRDATPGKTPGPSRNPTQNESRAPPESFLKASGRR